MKAQGELETALCKTCVLFKLSITRVCFLSSKAFIIVFRSRSANVGKGKATKRKADELDTSITDSEEKGDNQPKKAKTEVSSSTDSIAPTSRSGRLIKPKKFVDEDLNSSKTVQYAKISQFFPHLNRLC